METLVLVADQRDQYFNRGKSHGSAKFGSSPSRGFSEINCRASEYGGSLVSTPLKFCSNPLSYSSLSSPKTPTHTPKTCNKSRDGKTFKGRVKSSGPISISSKAGKKEVHQNQHTPFSELWAGPAYSNSPPPSSLPIPKFHMKPKRTVSLELPPIASEINLCPIAKSAPASPTRELKHSAIAFLQNDDDATKTLCRMLNLDIADD